MKRRITRTLRRVYLRAIRARGVNDARSTTSNNYHYDES